MFVSVTPSPIFPQYLVVFCSNKSFFRRGNCRWEKFGCTKWPTCQLLGLINQNIYFVYSVMVVEREKKSCHRRQDWKILSFCFRFRHFLRTIFTISCVSGKQLGGGGVVDLWRVLQEKPKDCDSRDEKRIAYDVARSVGTLSVTF